MLKPPWRVIDQLVNSTNLYSQRVNIPYRYTFTGSDYGSQHTNYQSWPFCTSEAIRGAERSRIPFTQVRSKECLAECLVVVTYCCMPGRWGLQQSTSTVALKWDHQNLQSFKRWLAYTGTKGELQHVLSIVHIIKKTYKKDWLCHTHIT